MFVVTLYHNYQSLMKTGETLYHQYLLRSKSGYMFGYYTSALLIGLGNGHLWPAFQNMIIGIARKDERGTANSTILISWDIGMGFGILLGGIVAEHFSYDAVFWMTATSHICGLIAFIFITRQGFRRLANTNSGAK